MSPGLGEGYGAPLEEADLEGIAEAHPLHYLFYGSVRNLIWGEFREAPPLGII